MTASAADVVVVGGGAAGCVVARRLAERGRDVLLLEAGPDLGDDPRPALRDGWRNPQGGDWDRDWGFESEASDGGSATPLRRGKLLGGTSWLTRFGVRGHPADFDAWAARGNSGWAFEDVLPVFRRIEADADFGDAPWHGADGPIAIDRYRTLQRSPIHDATAAALARLGFPIVDDHNMPGAVGVGPMPMSTRNGRRITTLDAYLGRIPRPVSLRIQPDSQVDRVLLHAGRVRGVRLTDGSEIGAELVILSAGVYGSPAILLRSGIGPAAHLREVGVAPTVGLPGVGKNLADHPGVDLDAGAGGDAASDAPLHTIATFRSTAQPADGPPDMMFWVQEPSENDGHLYLDPILLKPASRGTLRLRSADPLDPPRIDLPGLRTEADIDRLMEGYAVGLEVANDGAIRGWSTEPPPGAPKTRTELRERVLAGAYSLPHVVGTCRMGPSSGDGDVVDTDGRVHGIESLRVIDASVIPDAPSGFPHLVTIMAAEALAERC